MRYAVIVLAFSALAAGIHAEIYDAVAVSFGTHAIKVTEIERDLRLTAFLNGAPLTLSAEDKRKAADRLIDQMLIREEMAKAHLPLTADATAVLQKIKRTRFPKPGSYEPALQSYGITEPQLKAHLGWQVAVLAFIDVRFKANPPFFAWLDASHKNLHVQYREGLE